MLPHTFSAAATRITRSDELEVDPDEVNPPPHPAATAATTASPVNRPATLRVMEGSVGRNGSHYKNRPRSSSSGPQRQSRCPCLARGHHVLGPGAVPVTGHFEDRRKALQFRVAQEGGKTL